MATIRRCATCGAALMEGAPDGQCPECLIQLGLAAGAASASDLSDGGFGLLPREFGDYELLEEIARGGMGVVYKARQRSLDRLVAVKLILSGHFAGKDSIQRFRTEASAAAALQHPNIVAIHEVGVHQGEHYLAMDLVDGLNLAQFVKNQPLPAPHAARYLIAIAEAIHYAHERGILHRDLKPSNILIDANNQPRVTDFGLAKRLGGRQSSGAVDSADRTDAGSADAPPPTSAPSESGRGLPRSKTWRPSNPQPSTPDLQLTLTGQVLGSPNYIAPEQASGKRRQVTRQSDIYSLGAILYHLLTGRGPFISDTVAETLQQVLYEEPVAPRLLNPAAPRDLETICLKCLQKEPARRYATAQELADDLDRFLKDKPIQARPVSRLEKVWRWCRRKPAVASLGVATIILLLAVTIGSPIAAVRIERARQIADQNRRLAEGRLYVSDMNRALQALADDDLGTARTILDVHRNETEWLGFDWRYLWQRCRGAESVTLRGMHTQVLAVELSPEGSSVVALGRDGTLCAWDVTSQRLRFEIRHNDSFGGLGGLSLSADGTRGVIGQRTLGQLSVVDIRTGELVRSFDTGPEHVLRWLPDGQTVATTSTGYLMRLWNIEKGSNTFALAGQGDFMTAGDSQGLAVELSPDGRRLAGIEADPAHPGRARAIAIWDTGSKNVATMLPDSRFVTAMSFSPDAARLAVGAKDGTVRLWDTVSGREQLSFSAHLSMVNVVAFATRNQALVTGSSDQTIRLWDDVTGKERARLQGHESRVICLALSANKRWLASGSGDETVRLWNLDHHRSVPAQIQMRTAGLFSPDGKTIAGSSGPGQVAIWNVASGEERAVLPGSDFPLQFSSDGRRLLTGDRAYLKWWNLKQPSVEKSVPLPAVLSNCTHAIMAPNGRWLAGSTAEAACFLWEIGSAKAPARFPRLGTSSPKPFTFSSDSKVLLVQNADELGRVQIIDVESAQELATWIAGKSSILATAFSPDGKVMATGEGENTIKLWDAHHGVLKATWRGHRQAVYGLAFSPDGKLLASASSDGAVKLWNVRLNQSVATLPFAENDGHVRPQRVRSVWFSPDGNTLAAANSEGAIRFWQAASQIEIDQNAARIQIRRNTYEQ